MQQMSSLLKIVIRHVANTYWLSNDLTIIYMELSKLNFIIIGKPICTPLQPPLKSHSSWKANLYSITATFETGIHIVNHLIFLESQLGKGGIEEFVYKYYKAVK